MIKITFTKKITNMADTLCLLAIENEKANFSGLTPAEKKAVQNAIKQSDFSGKAGAVCTVLGGNRKIILAGVKNTQTPLDFQETGGRLASILSKDETVTLCGRTDEMSIETAYGILLGSYTFDKYLTKTKPEDKNKLKSISVLVSDDKKAKTLFKEKQAIAESVWLARDLCSEPANHLTPKIFADKVATFEKEGLTVEILDLKALKAKKFGMLLAVAQGSINEPRVAIVKWMGNPKKQSFDLGLVGKGVTFDAGGISLKPGAGMWDMKQDMTGAAVVMATMKSLAARKVKQNVVGIVGLVENLPSGSATRPGDIVTSLSGQTVEILNTDAEGRLVLGDCLWYIQQTTGVKKIIDLATLTGATMRALGDEYAGLFVNDDDLSNELTIAGNLSGEKLWRMPMTEAYNKIMDSQIADMKNLGGANAGGSTAACFLGRFIQDGVKWAHLDIAGVDKEEKGKPLSPKGATGWGVRLLNELIK